jgi:hypothetical protein
MSVSLYNQTHDGWVGSHMAWYCVLKLAEEFNWRRAGTRDPLQPGSGPGWKGSYALNNGQLVTAEDATALADALGRALSDTTDAPEEGWLLSGEGRDHLRNLVGFCRQGSFRIY